MRASHVGLEDRRGAAVGHDDRRHVLLDEVVGLGVGGLAHGIVGRLAALVEGRHDVVPRPTEARTSAAAKVVVEEVGCVRVVRPPSEEDEAFERPCRVCIEEGAALLEIEGDIDTEVGLELVGDLGCHDRRIRVVAADRGAELDLVRLREVKFGIDEELLCRAGIEVPGRLALTPKRNSAWREVGGHRRARRVVVVHELLAVDAHGDRLSDANVGPRRDRLVHADVERIQALARVDRDARIGLDGGDVVRARVVDAIDCARLKLDPALGALIAPSELEVRGHGLAAPIPVISLEDEAVALVPGHELVRAGAVGLVKDRLVGHVGCQVVRVLDAEGAEGDLGQEGDVRSAEVELDGQSIDRGDLLEVAGVRSDATGGLAGCRVGCALVGGCVGRRHARRIRGARRGRCRCSASTGRENDRRRREQGDDGRPRCA